MTMDKTVEMNANELVAHFRKPASELTKADIITFVSEKGIRMVDFMYPAEDGRVKTLNFMINNLSYLETILTDGERVDGSSLFPSFVEAESSDLYVVPRFSTAFVSPFSEIPTLCLLCSFLDKDGRPRELHTELAREALCYDSRPDYRTHYDEVNDGCSLLGRCPNFTMRLGRFASTRRLDYAALDSFVIFIAFEGRARLTDGEGNTVSLCAGETVLFPATNDAVTVEPLDGARFSFIETFTEG